MQDLVPEGKNNILIFALITLYLEPNPLLMHEKTKVFWSVIFRCTLESIYLLY